MMPSRTTQPYRQGARKPSGALTAMLRGTTAYGGNPAQGQRQLARQTRLVSFGRQFGDAQAHQRYGPNNPRPHNTGPAPYSTDRPRPHPAGNPFGQAVRDLAQATGRTGGIGQQVSQMAQQRIPDVHPDVIQAQLDEIRRRMGGR